MIENDFLRPKECEEPFFILLEDKLIEILKKDFSKYLSLDKGKAIIPTTKLK